MVPNADALYACDGRWWDHHYENLSFRGEMYTQDEDAAPKYGLNYIKGRQGVGLCTEPGVINTGQNSGFQAINLAYHLGAKRIALLGYDMQKTGGRHHWFGDHPKGFPNPTNVSSWAKNFTPLACDLDSEGVEVINCSRETALTCFPRMELSEWIKTLPAKQSTGNTNGPTSMTATG